MRYNSIKWILNIFFKLHSIPISRNEVYANFIDTCVESSCPLPGYLNQGSDGRN